MLIYAVGNINPNNCNSINVYDFGVKEEKEEMNNSLDNQSNKALVTFINTTLLTFRDITDMHNNKCDS